EEDEDQVEDDEEEDYEDDDEEDEDEEEDEDIEDEAGGENDDVEIIDGDESSEVQPAQATSNVEPTQYRPSATLQPLSAAQTGERSQDTTRTQQIAPFMLATQSLMEDDDCTVPSTPTLAQPRRGDGFAEALNSPAVNQRFLFGADSGNNPDLAQLESQRALGVDDTRMDLSQFDETGGRSMPSTPTVIVTQPDSFPADSQEDADTTLQEAETQDYSGSGEADQGGEEDDDLLEGDRDQEEEVAEEEVVEEDTPSSDPQASGEGPSRPGTGKEEPDASSQEKPEGTDSSAGASSSSSQSLATVMGGAAIPPLVSGQPQQTRTVQGRAQGLRRGGPTRGRGAPQYWGSGGASSSGSSRGAVSYRGSRGGRGGFRGSH
ncbi:nucleoprotein TPR, partial [Elysia marginata]